jgi:hypothetical protein
LSILVLLAASACEEGAVRPLEVSLRYEPSELDFGTVSVGRSASLSISIRNEGGRGASLWLDRAPPDVGIEPPLVQVPARGNATVKVVFRPTTEREIDGGIVLAGTEASVEIAVRARAVAVPFEVADALDFGFVRIGEEETRRLEIRNRLDEELLVTVGVGASGSVQSYVFVPTNLVLPPRGVGEFPVTFRPLAQEADQVASFDVTCTRCPKATVRLLGAGRRAAVQVAPSSIVFERMKPGSTETRAITVENVGRVSTGTLTVEVDGLRFTLDEAELPSLAPGEQAELSLSYQAGFSTPHVHSELRLRADDGSVVARVPIDVTVKGTLFDVRLPPFLAAPVGWSGGAPHLARIEVHNLGASPNVAVSAEVEGPDAGDFEIWPEGDGVIRGTKPAYFLLAFRPRREGTHEAALVFRGDGDETTVPFEAWGNRPVARCPSVPERVGVLEELSLRGRDDSPLGDAACRWRLAEWPGALDGELGAGCEIAFRPPLVGRYRLDLELTDLAGNVDVCSVAFEAHPRHDLWVELFWDEASDVDLYLFDPTRGDPDSPEDWWSPAACHYANCRAPDLLLEWGPDPANDPILDFDDIRGTGPENIRIPVVPAPAEYVVGLHWFNERGKSSTRATVNVYCLGEKAGGWTVTLDAPKLFFRMGQVSFDSAGTCGVEFDPIPWADFGVFPEPGDGS